MARPRKPSAASETSTVPEHDQELSSMYDYLVKIILLGPSGTGKSCLLHRFVHDEFRVLSSQTIGVEFSSKIVKIGSSHTAYNTGSYSRGKDAAIPRSKRIKLQLWDTAGTERFRAVSRSYYRGAAGAILVYDVASLSTFNALPTFLLDARALASPGLCVVLAGNKIDIADGTITPPSTADGDLTPSNASVSSRHTGERIVGSAPSESSSLRFGSRWTASTSIEGREVSADLAGRWASKTGIPVVAEVSALSGQGVDDLFVRLARMILTKIELGEIDPDDPQSGIQYGDPTWDRGSVVSGLTADEDVTRRRKKGLINGLQEFGDVFHKPGGRGCC